MTNKCENLMEDDDTDLRCATGKTRLYVEVDLGDGAEIGLDKDQSHYLLNVLRMGVGDPVLLFNGRDGEWACEIAEATKKSCGLVVVRQTRAHQPLPDIWLLFAPVKKARLDFIAQKATEMGAGVIQPVITRRTIVSRVKDARLHANVIEAAEQCGLVAVPEVREAEKLDAILDRWTEQAPGRRILFCDEAAAPGRALADLEALAQGSGRGRPYALLIGPEGGFDDAERARLHAREDTVALSLGPRIMRADTAAIAALAAVQLVLGDW
jgi:16S rRNA (uracil1498-N3)-methyltransferase